MTPPYATLTIAVNGGAPQTGSITANFSDVLRFRSEHTATVQSFRFELYEYPDGFTCPAGWSTDSAGVYYFAGANPPDVTLPANTALWGNFLPRLTINNGDPGASGLPASQFIDESTVFRIVEPDNGVPDVGFGEAKQFDSQRGYVGALKSMARLLAIGLGAGFGTGILADHSVTHIKYQTIAAQKLLGNSTGSSGNVQELGVTNGLQFTSTNIGIADQGVTYARLQDVSAQARLLGRGGASGVGSPEELTVGGGLEFNATQLRRSALTGAITAAAGSNSTSITANAIVPTTDLATVASARILGRVSASTGNWEILTGTQVTTLLDVVTLSLKGLVPAPTSSSGRVLKDDLTWGTVSATATPGGSSGQLQWNSSSSMAGTANITTDGSRLIFGSGASGGHVGIDNNVSFLHGKTFGGATAQLIGGLDASDTFRIGDPTQVGNLYFDIKAGSGYVFWIGSVGRFGFNDQGVEYTQKASESGTPSNALRINAGAHAAFTANTEVRDVTFALARTVTLLTGAYANQRSVRINPVTLTSAGAVTIDRAATLSIEGPPVSSASGGVAPTFAYELALELESGALGFGTNPARQGHIRLGNAYTVYARTTGGGDQRVIEAADNITFGDGSAVAGHTYIDAGPTTKSIIGRLGFTPVIEITPSATDFKSRALINVATLTGNVLNSEVDDGNSGTSKTLDFSNSGPAHKLTLTGNCTLTLTAPAQHKWLQITLVQDATGGRTLTFPASVKWANGTQPAWITTANAINIATLWYDGTNYFGVGSAGFA